MHIRIIFWCLILGMVFGFVQPASADLIGHWKFDEGAGTIAMDSSGNGHDGVVENGDDSVWVAGQLGGALSIGNGVYVTVPPEVWIPIDNQFSITFWAFGGTGLGDHWGFYAGDAAGRLAGCHIPWSDGSVYFDTTTGWERINKPLAADTATGKWNHWAFLKNADNGDKKIYLNGELWHSGSGYTTAIADVTEFYIGSGPNGGIPYLGLMDDFRLYDHALSEVEILGAMTGEPWPYAFGPVPKDGAYLEDTWVSMSWSPGDLAVSHNVYIGDNFDDVDAGAEGAFRGNQASTNFVIGFPGFPYPDGLIPGRTYYWRIDEVNDTEPNSPWKGDIWSFSIPPKTAYFPDPADGAESVAIDVELSWTGGFGAKLHTVYFGDNFEDVSNAAGGIPQGSATYIPGPLQMAKTYYWRVDEFDAVDTFKGDVWSFITEGAVGSPNPVKDAVDVTQSPFLTWVPGVFADTHEIYFGAEPTALELKGSGNLGEETYEPGQLEWNTTYYWRVDEANNTNADSPWTGPLWNFTTANFLIIDDMESYNDIDEGEPGSNRIYVAWVDGFDDPTNGSQSGHLDPPFYEETIVHGGNKSLPMYYDNAVGKSESTLTLTDKRDWTINGVNTLTIWFRGASGNAAEQMYVTLNGSARVDHDDPDVATKTTWIQWNVDLQTFADQGVNLSNVNSITLGFSSVTGGTGMLYFDDIRLYTPEP